MIYFLVFFLLLSALHLYACYFHIEKTRKLTKPLLLLSLSVFYAVYAKPVNPLVLAALACGMFGDIFLIRTKDIRFFMTGACIFSLGHVLYGCVVYTKAFEHASHADAWTVGTIALIYIAAVVFAGIKIVPHIGRDFMRPLMPAYLGLVGLVNIGAWILLVSTLRTGGENAFAASLLILGATLFLVSDTILSFGVFKGEKPQTNFFVMLTYIGAQLCLWLGFIRLS